MSKYIDKDKVLEYIIFGVVGKDITCGELKRAIESLPAIEVSEDCISRQDALEALDRIGSLDTEADREYARDIFDSIPLVTPTVREDCISREWVLNKIHAYAESYTTSTGESVGADYCAEFVEEAPSVTPTERTGEWEHHIDRNGIPWERCSECGDCTLSVDRENINYCPNCGARMKGGAE